MGESTESVTKTFSIGGFEGTLLVFLRGEVPVGIEIKMGKFGSTLYGLTEAVGLIATKYLEKGGTIHDLATLFSDAAFDPAGYTGDDKVPTAKSILDFVFQWLNQTYA